MFNIFSQLNNSAIFNSAITIALTAIIIYVAISFLIKAIKTACHQVKSHSQLMNAIAHGKLTKKELIKIAQTHSIKYSKLNKYQLQNVLIMELVYSERKTAAPIIIHKTKD
jgi:hypothetical protein